MMNEEADKVIKQFFDLLKNRYQNNLESMKASEFVFNYVHLFSYKFHRINPNRGGSINPINKIDNTWFRYAVAVVINHEVIGKNPERITKIKPFINTCNWKGINYPSQKGNWKKFEENNR